MHMTTNIGKPYEGKPHVRFDEEGLGSAQPFTLAATRDEKKIDTKVESG